MLKILIAALALSASAATVQNPTAQQLDEKWNAVFEQMADLRASIKAAQNLPVSAERDALVENLRSRFASLRRDLFAFERELEAISARRAQENNRRALKSGRDSVRRNAAEETPASGGGSEWTDEADFKESLSGRAVPAPAAPSRPAGKEHWENPDDWKESLGGFSPVAPNSELRRPVPSPTPAPIPERVGKGAWENPDDWKSGL